MASKPKANKQAKAKPEARPKKVEVVEPPSIDKISSRNKIKYQSDFTGEALDKVDRMIDTIYELANAVAASNGCSTREGVSSALDQYIDQQEDIDDMLYPTPEYINLIARQIDIDLYSEVMPAYFTESMNCDSDTVLGQLIGKWIEFYGYNSDMIQDRIKLPQPSKRSNVPVTAILYDEDKMKSYDFKVRLIKIATVGSVKTFKAFDV